MSDGTKIEWTDATWNPITGCSVVSPGCTNCYAMRLAGTRLRHHPSRQGLTQPTKAGPVWNGKVRLNDEWILQPVQWTKPRMIFVCAHGDLFHESVPDAWIDKVFAVMAMGHQHTFQVLTKRAERMRSYMTELSQNPADRLADADQSIHGDDQHACGVANFINGWSRWREMPDDGNPLNGRVTRWPLPNVWLGVSAEDQQRHDERVPLLLRTPATRRFVSAEPLLAPIDIRANATHCPTHDYDGGFCLGLCPDRVGLDWIIVGGESGPGARDMDQSWAHTLRDHCAERRIAFFMKQMAHKAAIPPDLMVREFPR